MRPLDPTEWDTDPDLPGNMVNTVTGEVVTSGQYETWLVTGRPEPGTQLATVSAGEIEALLEARQLPIVAWAGALLNKAEYQEDRADDAGLEMVAAILGGQTSAEILAATNMRTVLDMLGDKPGAHSPLLEITGAHPMKSTFEDGPSCFAVISATEVASGEQFKFTCGGRAVQAAILAHVYRDLLPFRCILTRRLKPTRAGFYPLNLEAGG